MNSVKYTKEILEEACANSKSVSEVMRLLGIRETGGSHSHITRRIRHFNIDTSHFVKNHRKGKPSEHRKLPEEVLVLRTQGGREKTSKLRRSLLESNVQYVCSGCSIEGVWNGEKLVLEIDHKNGN